MQLFSLAWLSFGLALIDDGISNDCESSVGNSLAALQIIAFPSQSDLRKNDKTQSSKMPA